MRTGVLVSQVMMVLLIITAGLWGGTQYCAWQLGYQVRLGPPWAVVAGTSLYYPWRLFQWWYAFEPYAPRIFLHGGLIAAGGGLVATGASILLSVIDARQARRVTTYGSSRWA